LTHRINEREKMNSKFQIGQEVTAIANAQGLVKGITYQVIQVISEQTPWGSYTDYILSGGDMKNGLLQVSNGSVLLKAN